MQLFSVHEHICCMILEDLEYGHTFTGMKLKKLFLKIYSQVHIYLDSYKIFIISTLYATRIELKWNN